MVLSAPSDPAAQSAALSPREMQESLEQYNQGITAIDAARKALDKTTLSAREYAKAEVDPMNPPPQFCSALYISRFSAKSLRCVAQGSPRRSGWVEGAGTPERVAGFTATT